MLTSPVFTKLWGQQVVDQTNAKTAAVHKKLWGTERKPKVYYACITAEEAGEFKLRHDDEGYYTRSTKIQAAVQAYIELPGKALDIFHYDQTYDREVNAERRARIKKNGAKYNQDMGVWYAETRKDARKLCGAGYYPDNNPRLWRFKTAERRNYKIDPSPFGDSSSWELWCHNSLTDTWVFYKKGSYYQTWH